MEGIASLFLHKSKNQAHYFTGKITQILINNEKNSPSLELALTSFLALKNLIFLETEGGTATSAVSQPLS